MGNGEDGGVAGARLWGVVLAAQREGQRMLSEALRPLGLTPAQAEVLAALAGGAPLTLNGLGERLVCETGSPSRLIDGMVKAGWVTRARSPRDGRAVLLSLTERGAALAARGAEVTAAFQQDLAAALEPGQAEAATGALWRLVAHLPAGRALKRRAGAG